MPRAGSVRTLKYVEQGKQLKAAREQAGLSGESLGVAIGVTRFTIAKYEQGEIVPSKETRHALGRVLGEATMSAIEWPRPNSPASYKRASQLAPPGTPGAALKEMRLGLAGPPSQFEMAQRLGMTEQGYRWVETRGGQLTAEIMQKLAQVYSASELNLLKMLAATFTGTATAESVSAI